MTQQPQNLHVIMKLSFVEDPLPTKEIYLCMVSLYVMMDGMHMVPGLPATCLGISVNIVLISIKSIHQISLGCPHYKLKIWTCCSEVHL